MGKLGISPKKFLGFLPFWDPLAAGDAAGLLRARGLREARPVADAAEAEGHGGPEGVVGRPG